MDDIIDELNSIKTYLNLPVTLYDEIMPVTDECKRKSKTKLNLLCSKQNINHVVNNRYEDWKKDFEVFKQAEGNS